MSDREMSAHFLFEIKLPNLFYNVPAIYRAKKITKQKTFTKVKISKKETN